jgi:hypothetical protein
LSPKTVKQEDRSLKDGPLICFDHRLRSLDTPEK